MAFKIADAYIEVTLDQDALQRQLSQLGDGGGGGGSVGSSGERSGGAFAQGFQQGFVRNSPMIAAAIGGALAAGAPVAIAGATAMFAGIGVVAAAQSEVVQQAWSKTWSGITADAEQDSAVLVPVLTRAASTIGESFQRMRPQLQDAFSASAPLIDTFVGSVTRAAENALPGMVRAVQSAGPVVSGLGSLMESIGTGISSFFDNLSAHAPAAGAAFAAIGDALEQVLPLLGDILGQGAELSATVLPMLASALGAVRTVVSALGPALPVVVSAFAGLKAATAGMNVIDNIADGLGRFSTQAASGAVGAERARGGMSALGLAIPIVGAALGVAVNAWGEHDRQVQENVATFTNLQQAMLIGGDAATTAGLAADKATWFWTALGVATEDIPGFKKAADDAHALFDAMSPLQQAQAEVTHWTNELAAAQGNSSYAIKDMEGNVVSAATAEGELSAASQRATDIQRQLEQATSGMSRTLQQAADAAGQLDSALEALNGGQLSLNDAQRAFRQSIDDSNAALATNGQTLDINTQAGRDNADALDAIAEAGNASAEALYKQTGDYGAFTGAMVSARDTLYDQAIAFGMSDAAARAYVDSVLAIPPITSMDIETNTPAVATELLSLGGQLSGLPQGQALVTWASDEAVQKLSQLGYDVVGLPNGEVMITATDHATPITSQVVAQILGINGMGANPTIGANAGPFSGVYSGVLGSIATLNGSSATPTANLNSGPFSGALAVANADFGAFGVRTATPTAALNDGPFQGVFAGVMGAAATLAAQHPTPIANLNAGPLLSAAAGATGTLGTLGVQHPMPTAGLNTGPLIGSANGAIGTLGTLGGMHPNPVATMSDFASGVARSIASAVNSIPAYRTVTIAVQQVGAALASFGRADGGPIGLASGGPVRGAGGPRDDLVPAMLGHTPYRLSNGEFVVKASSVDKYGQNFMAALNAGVLPVPKGLAVGGSSSNDAGASRLGVSVDSININLNGPVNGDARELARKLGPAIREELRRLERTYA